MPNGREIKVIVTESSIQEAITASVERAKKNLIPVFQLTGTEVSKSDEEELIVYAKQLSLLDEDYPNFYRQKDTDGKQVCGCLLRIDNIKETFVTTDFMEKS